MKHYRFSRLSLGWQIFIGLLAGIVVGMIFLSELHRDHRLTKFRDDLLADDSNDRHANCDLMFNGGDCQHW